MIFAACSSGSGNIKFELNSNDRVIISAISDKKALIDYVHAYSERPRSLDRKYEAYRIASYLRAEDARSTSAALAMSRAAYMCAESEKDDDLRLKAAEAGAEAAEAAGAMRGSREAAYYYAVNSGIVLSIRGLPAIGRLSSMKEAIDYAVTDQSIDSGGPLRVGGMLYLKAPAWPTGFGDIDYALEMLSRSVELFPDFPQNRIHYAEALLENGNVREAGLQLSEAELVITPERWGTDYARMWKEQISTLKKRLQSAR